MYNRRCQEKKIPRRMFEIVRIIGSRSHGFQLGSRKILDSARVTSGCFDIDSVKDKFNRSNCCDDDGEVTMSLIGCISV